MRTLFNCTSFNSYMVRLKEHFVKCNIFASYCFNSYMVRLKEEYLGILGICSLSFNSYMVRLKAWQKTFGCSGLMSLWFQFLHGTIKGFRM